MSAPLSIRSASDYGLSVGVEGLSQAEPLAELALTLWGVPASTAHDGARFPKGSPGSPAGCPAVENTSCVTAPSPSQLADEPFTLSPTTCSNDPAEVTLDLLTYGDPEHPTHSHAEMPAATGCDQLAFNPSAAVSLTTEEASSPSGLELEVANPMELSPAVPAPSELRETALALPAEVELNAQALAGHPVCSDTEAAIGREEPAGCPSGSKLGAFSMRLPSGVVPGFVYLGQPEPDGSLRLLLLTSGQGLEAKLVAVLETEPESEEPVLWLEELPQLPVSEYALEFPPGPESLLITPLYCETYEAETLFEAWDEKLSLEFAHTHFTIDSGPMGASCLGPAEHLQVSLSPSAVPADGSSAVTATATVTDAGGQRVPRDQVVFSSTDAGEKIGPVENLGNGTYAARVVASSAPGSVTITATDNSVAPPLSGTAQLRQLAPGPERRPSAPKASLTKKPPHVSRDRRPTFRFTADVQGSSFSCGLDGHPFRACHSPFRTPKLAPGRHVFRVRAEGPTGAVGAAVAYRFKVRRARRR